MMNTREEIVDWLQDAYAMERGLEITLEKQAKNDDLMAHVKNRAARHLDETRRHAEEVKAALESLGTHPSSIKTGMGMMTESTKGMGTMFAKDERIKDLLTAYSMEHFEIACYTALAEAARVAGLPQVEKACQSILPDEEKMAAGLRESLPKEVNSYLAGHRRAA